MGSRRPFVRKLSKYLVCFIGLSFVIFVCISLYRAIATGSSKGSFHGFGKSNVEEEILADNAQLPVSWQKACSYWSCLNVFQCAENENGVINVYVYPERQYRDNSGQPLINSDSREFLELLEGVYDSTFYTSDPLKACLYIPHIDLLNLNAVAFETTAKILTMLPHWNGTGQNHMMFTMFQSEHTQVLNRNTGKAVIASAQFHPLIYRHTFDLCIPMYNPLLRDYNKDSVQFKRSIYLLILDDQYHPDLSRELESLTSAFGGKDVRVLQSCPEGDGIDPYFHRCSPTRKRYKYPEIVQRSTFCLFSPLSYVGQATISDTLRFGCIPVMLNEKLVMPFFEKLDWRRAAIFVRRPYLQSLPYTLSQFNDASVLNYRRQGRFYWSRYMSSMSAIGLSALQIMNDRVFPYRQRTYAQWNDPEGPRLANPLFLPLRPSPIPGCTAVVLAYNRIKSLFDLVSQLATTACVAKILVVWNNPEREPPENSHWPRVNKPFKVIRSKQNHLSNRFFPYREIETDCVLSLDDDITMLTNDELEFGFDAWREFPDRLVGYPPRVHALGPALAGATAGEDQVRYESEWVNNISIVLTGAAFYHKYYHYLFTNALPIPVRDWLDRHTNCEDIAMNFLVANQTGKAPIKVLPRKKFRTIQDTNLSSDLQSYMMERNECMTEFSRLFGRMPLEEVPFRADPVLLNINLPDEAKLYKDVGSL